MNISALEQINSLQPNQNPQSPEALRKAAMQFEAVLLMQLTSSLSSTGLSEDEDSLFGGDSGTNLSKQMFSEQLANTMAQSGGVGLADIIMRQFGAAPSKQENGTIKGLSKTVNAVRNSEERPNARMSAPVINRSGKVTPVDISSFTGNPDDFAVVSTFEGEARSIGLEESQRHLILDGKVVNTTRARIVPNEPVIDVTAIDEVSGYPPNPKVKAPAMPAKNTPAAVTGSTRVSGDEKDAESRTVEYQMPVTGRISSGFGNRYHPIDHKMKFHAGVDIAVPLGTPVDAAADGTIEFAGWNGGYGNLVIIRHPDGRETRYGHLSKILVSEGEKVSAGQEFALSGSTGKSTGPHLHFEMRENGEVVNPLKIMSNVLPNGAER